MHGRQKINTDLAQWMDWLRNSPPICGVGASVSSQTSPVLRSTDLVYKKRPAHPNCPSSHTLFFYTLTLVPTHTRYQSTLAFSNNPSTMKFSLAASALFLAGLAAAADNSTAIVDPARPAPPVSSAPAPISSAPPAPPVSSKPASHAVDPSSRYPPYPKSSATKS